MSVSFDRAAGYYDRTRGLPPDVLERVADGIVELAGAREGTCFLEPGVGTGRIALPLLRRGYPYTGVDLSEPMMDELRRKAADMPDARLTLVAGDAAALPFPDASFDVALTVHLLHLVPGWRAALGEIRRVLAPGGVFLYCHDDPDTPLAEWWLHWNRLLSARGVPLERQGGSKAEVLAALGEQGAALEERVVARWRLEEPVGALLDGIAGRVWSRLWSVPDEALLPALDEMRAWARATYGPDDAVLSSEMRFVVVAARHWSSV